MPMVYETGPYLNAAVLCERTMQEADGVVSLIRIVDTLTQAVQGPAVPDRLVPFQVGVKLALVFKTGAARGRFGISIQVEEPSGQRREVVEITSVTFTGPAEAGMNLLGDVNLAIGDEGVYWIDVRLDGTVLTRIPLRVVYSPQRTP